MAMTETLSPPATLPDVAETTGQRVKRLRRELGWTQDDLESASGVSVATLYLIENDKEGKKGERTESLAAVLAAVERERQRRLGENGPQEDRVLMEFLARPDLEDVRIRRIGRNRKMRYLMVGIPDPDATPEEIREALEDFHREQRRGDEPNG